MPIRSKIEGTWECLFLKAINVNNEEDVVHPYTKQIKGSLVYSSDGYMASLLQRPDVPKYIPGPLLATPEQYQKAAEGTHGYHGPYYLKESPDGKIKLYHNMTISLPTNWTGDTQVRLCKMWEENGRLYMVLRPEYDIPDEHGNRRRVEAGWRKRESNTRTTPP